MVTESVTESPSTAVVDTNNVSGVPAKREKEWKEKEDNNEL